MNIWMTLLLTLAVAFVALTLLGFWMSVQPVEEEEEGDAHD